ncbi:alpha/beta fold hydrolase [Patescibacteria group bacterium]
MKKNIVLIHGWGANTQKLEPLEFELEKLKWKVLLTKLPGFDLKPPSKPWSVEDYSDFVFGKASAKFGNFVVFGHSFGGRVAVDMVTKHDNVTEIVLCATSGITRGNLLKRYAIQTAAKLGKPLVSSKYKKLLYKVAREHDYEKVDGVMKETFKKVIRYSIKTRLSKLDKEILILWGSEDKMTPTKDAKYIEDNTERAKRIVYDGFGHTLPYVHGLRLAKDIDLWYTQLK